MTTRRPWTDGKKLVIEAQESSGLPDDLWLYAPVSGQYLSLPAGQAFLDRVEFDDDVAVRWHPAVDPESTVVIDPDVRFGKPAEVRFYCDADVLGLARMVCDLRSDCTFPGDPGKTIKRRTRPACPVTSPAPKDPVWLPIDHAIPTPAR